MPSRLDSICEEVFCFFYVYELMCYYVWYFNGYWNVACLNSLIIAGVITINVVAKRKILAAVVQMTQHHCSVAVKRDDVWQTIKSTDLVPGDLVRVGENCQLPCDMAIVKGSTVCDESMLTGESMPVQKFPIPTSTSDVYAPEQTGKKHTLFAGAMALSSGRQEEILAVVQTTGAHTVRGQLIQSILYPSLIRFKYDEHLKACVLFLAIYGFVASYLAMKFLMENAGLENTLFSFVYGMFMLSAVLSPLIPVVRTIGQVNATKRLTKENIFCLNPQRIPLCGKVRVFGFDKTGTITKQGLDLRGCIPVNPHGRAFLPEFDDITSDHLNPMMKFALASCHAVGSLDGELVGNEVEVRMFQSTAWSLIEEEGVAPVVQSPDGANELQVLKRFEFDHNRMSMSVVMRHLGTGKIYVFCKGSYEKIESLSLSRSLPSDYTNTAEKLAKHGCYVLGMAYKDVTELAAQGATSWNHFLADRDTVEARLSLLGLVMFQNELKSDSAGVVADLRNGGIRSVMITGDNALTGCYIARECGMVRGSSKVILGDILPVNEQGGRALVWKDVESEEEISHKTLLELVGEQERCDDPTAPPPYELAVTGHAFNYLVKMGELTPLLFHIRIFSRMTPAEKVGCITQLMSHGAITGMCGDGGNDCGALRVAHVGVALSDTEASVVSPFTSKDKTIASVVALCKEGRCSLATVFANLKFLIMYGLIGSGLRFVMYWHAVFMSEWCFMFCDGLILVGMSYAITLAQPLQTLGQQRPTSSLIGPTTVLSVLGQQMIHTIFLYVAIHDVLQQPWYCPFTPESVDLVKWWLLQDSNLGTAIFMIIAPQQMIGGVAFSLGAQFRQPVWKNRFLMGFFLFLEGLVLYLSLADPNRVTEQFRMATSTNVIGLPDIPMPRDYRVRYVLLVMGNLLAILLFESCVIQGPIRNICRHRFHTNVLQMRL